MKTYKQFIIGLHESYTSPDKAVKLLHKTKKSLLAHIARGNRLNSARSQDLVDKYEETKDWLKSNHPNHWKQYVKESGYHEDHDAYEFFA